MDVDKINKDNKVLWNIESTKLNDISYALYINYIKNINIELYNRNKKHRASYMTYDDFLNRYHEHNKKFIKQAKIIIRKDKIDKLTNSNKYD